MLLYAPYFGERPAQVEVEACRCMREALRFGFDAIHQDCAHARERVVIEQVAIELTASLAQQEPDPYLAQVYRFGLLEDFDHMYRYSALLDRLEGKDSNNILQSYTDVLPGRPTVVEHRAPENDLRRPFDRKTAAPLTKLNALTLTAAEHQTHDYYMNIGPLFADPVARQLYAEIASIEEQHVTQYESLLDPSQSLLGNWLLHEAMEAYTYYSCLQQESNPRLKAIWERMLNYELGHFHLAAELFEKHERRDPQEIVGERLPEPIAFAQELLEIRNAEASHALLLKECLEKLGADPTAQTPCADLVGVETMGLLQAASDPRTTLAQTLHAALAAELIDNEGWEDLIALAREMGHDDMATRFKTALDEEGVHLTEIRNWYALLTMETSELM